MAANEFYRSEGLNKLTEEKEPELHIEDIQPTQREFLGSEAVQTQTDEDSPSSICLLFSEQIEESEGSQRSGSQQSDEDDAVEELIKCQELGDGAEKVDEDAITSIYLLFPEQTQEDMHEVEESEEYSTILPRAKPKCPLEALIDTYGLDKTQEFINSLRIKKNGKEGFEEFRPEPSCMKLLPVDGNKEAIETERDDDSLSTTSTVDYRYLEDDGSNEDVDDEDEWDSSPPPTNYRAAYDFSKYVSRWVDSWNDDWRKYGPFTWIHVFAYFNKDKGYGGYGVLIRNARAVPIVSSAKFSKVGKSFFYQVFKGIHAGVTLAEKLGLSDLHIQCNSYMVPVLYDSILACSCDGCLALDASNRVCKLCHSRIMFYDSEDRDMSLVAPLIMELKHKGINDVEGDWGIAAHVVAKMEKKRRLEATDDESGETEHVILPADFIQRLKKILWRDSFSLLRA